MMSSNFNLINISAVDFSAITVALSTKEPAAVRGALALFNAYQAMKPSSTSLKTYRIVGTPSPTSIGSDSEDDLEVLDTPDSIFGTVSDASSQTSIASDVEKFENSSCGVDHQSIKLVQRGLPSTTTSASFGPAGHFFHVEPSAENKLDDAEGEDEVAEDASPIKTPSLAIAADLGLDSNLDIGEKGIPDWRLTCGFQFVPLIDAETGDCFEDTQDAHDVEVANDDLHEWRLTTGSCFLPLAAPMDSVPQPNNGGPFLSRDASAFLFPSAAHVPQTKMETHCGPAECIDDDDDLEAAFDTEGLSKVFDDADEHRFEELKDTEASLSLASPSLSEASDYTLVSDEDTLLRDLREFEAYKSGSALAESWPSFNIHSISDLTVDFPEMETILVPRRTKPFHQGWRRLRKALKPQRSRTPVVHNVSSLEETSCLLSKAPITRKSFFKRFVSLL